MAQAAAAAAAALTLRNLTISTVDKQLDSMYKTVEKLQDVGFPKFQEQLIRQAFHYGKYSFRNIRWNIRKHPMLRMF